MVKGNWERRVERAAKQKAAKRDAAAAKAKGQLVDPLDILNAIFLKDPDASVWVAGQGNKLCAAYFRNGDCPNRRCKWSHAETIAPFGPGGHVEATTEPPLGQVQTVAARLDGAVPKAEFNDASALAPVPEGVVARVLDWCSAYRAGAAAATCKALRRARRCPRASAPRRTPRGPACSRRGGAASYEWREASVRRGPRRRPPRARLRCGAARRLPRVLPAGSEPTAARRRGAGGAALQHFTRGGRGGARGRGGPWSSARRRRGGGRGDVEASSGSDKV